MATHSQHVDLPFPPAQLFALVSDIESYPLFLPHVASARILRRTGDVLLVAQSVRFKVLRLTFYTRAVFDAPRRIHVTSVDAPFGSFTEEWSFGDGTDGGTVLRSDTAFTFRSSMVRMALDATFAELQSTTMKAFEARARALFETKEDLLL
jgi:coenzyme Q-binding protein COQ10